MSPSCENNTTDDVSCTLSATHEMPGNSKKRRPIDEMDGMDTSLILPEGSKRSRRKPVVYVDEDYEKLMLCDIPKEEMQAALEDEDFENDVEDDDDEDDEGDDDDDEFVDKSDDGDDDDGEYKEDEDEGEESEEDYDDDVEETDDSDNEEESDGEEEEEDEESEDEPPPTQKKKGVSMKKK